MINGTELVENKNNLIKTIEFINSILLYKLMDLSILNSIILPIFIKLKDQNIGQFISFSLTIKDIKNNWESQTCKYINNDRILRALEIIKKQIDQDLYIEINDASFYATSNLIDFEDRLKQIEKEVIYYFTNNQREKAQQTLDKMNELRNQIKLLKENKEDINYTPCLDRLQNLQQNIFKKCSVLCIKNTFNNKNYQIFLFLFYKLYNIEREAIKQINKYSF